MANTTQLFSLKKDDPAALYKKLLTTEQFLLAKILFMVSGILLTFVGILSRFHFVKPYLGALNNSLFANFFLGNGIFFLFIYILLSSKIGKVLRGKIYVVNISSILLTFIWLLYCISTTLPGTTPEGRKVFISILAFCYYLMSPLFLFSNILFSLIPIFLAVFVGCVGMLSYGMYVEEFGMLLTATTAGTAITQTIISKLKNMHKCSIRNLEMEKQLNQAIADRNSLKDLTDEIEMNLQKVDLDSVLAKIQVLTGKIAALPQTQNSLEIEKIQKYHDLLLTSFYKIMAVKKQMSMAQDARET